MYVEKQITLSNLENFIYTWLARRIYKTIDRCLYQFIHRMSNKQYLYHLWTPFDQYAVGEVGLLAPTYVEITGNILW